MEKETESAIDYYVLFQDLSKYAQQSNDGKEGGAVQFLWCSIGKLTGRQARGVEAKLDLEYKTRFEKESPWYLDLNELLMKGARESKYSGKSRIVGYRRAVSQESPCETTVGKFLPGSWELFEELCDESPQNNSQLRQNKKTSSKPEMVFLELTPALRLQIQQKKGLVARSNQDTETFVVSKAEAIAPKIWRSFVQLLPLSVLTDIWHRVGCPSDVEPLRCTAVVWCRETFWNEAISLVGQKTCPEDVDLVFKSSLDEQEMTEPQREVLWKCVDVANRVRKTDGSKEMPTKKRQYKLAQANIAATPPMLEEQPSIIIDENLIEQIEVPMDEPGVAPPIFIAASAKRKTPSKKSAFDDYNESRPPEEPNEVWVANEEPIAVRDDGVVKTLQKTNELLAKQNSLIEKGTAVNKKGFASLKPIDIRSLTELIKTLPPPAAGEDENWLSAQTVAQSTGESVDNLKKQRSEDRGGKKITINDSEYGMDTEGRIWFKASDRVFLYYEATITGQDLSR